MSEIQIREVLPAEFEDTGSLTQRAYAGYARPGDRLWEDYFGMLAWRPPSTSINPWASGVIRLAT
jgi:hypothetical protein